jgi:hypothetical protein
MRLIALAGLALGLAAGRASGYPQFQLSLGEDRCSACHLSPAGGGLINDYGRDAAGSAISRGGDGRLLHGLWSAPGWLALGGDVRLAVGDHRVAGRNQLLAFPMQADLYAHVQTGSWSVSFTAGVRGAARSPTPPLTERLASREHYAMYERGDYAVRAGRFFPVFGLRLADHTAYVRRFLGFGLLEEPYALELARSDAGSEARLTGFVPQPIPFLGAGYRDRGVAASYERHIGDAALAGAHARIALGDDERRYAVGAIGKLWLPGPGLLWQAELDVQRQSFRGHGPGRTQLAGYLSATTWLAHGVMLTGAGQLWQPDLALRGTLRESVEVNLQYFPLAHVELHLLGRATSSVALGSPDLLTLLQLHYYL